MWGAAEVRDRRAMKAGRMEVNFMFTVVDEWDESMVVGGESEVMR